jgi:hypothetical protein
MNTRKALIVSTVAGLALVGGLTLAAPGWEAMQPAFAAAGAGHRHHFGRHGGGHFGGHKLMRLCSERRGERLADLVAFVESFAGFTPEQTGAWNELTAALDSGSDRIGTACGELEAAGKPESAPDKLARLETLLEAGLKAVRDVRPAFDGFYAVLDAEQKAALDRMAMHRRR